MQRLKVHRKGEKRVSTYIYLNRALKNKSNGLFYGKCSRIRMERYIRLANKEEEADIIDVFWDREHE